MSGENWSQEDVDRVKADYGMTLEQYGVFEHLHGVSLVSKLLESAFSYATSPLVLSEYPNVDTKLSLAYEAIGDLYQALGVAWGEQMDKEEKESKENG
jgi:hypothetical protein